MTSIEPPDSTHGAFSPPALERLRRPEDERPVIDPSLAGGLRAWLEDVVADAARRLSPSAPLHISLGIPARPDGPSVGGVHRALVDALFRLRVIAGPAIRPFEDALCVLAAEGRTDVLRAVRHLGLARRVALRGSVEEHAARLASDWSVIPPTWLPRLSERVSIPLAGGRILLSDTPNLALGTPPAGRASVCLVDLDSGIEPTGRSERRAVLALLETLRSGVPPFRVASYHSATGHLDIDDPTDEALARAVDVVLTRVDAAVPSLTGWAA